jgi:alpha-D-xyloside xylohydrolase
MGIAGIPWWTTDIGGFSGGDPTDEGFRELLIRWFQWGTFCPVMRLHGDRRPTEKLFKKDGSPALFTGGDNEVWSFGDAAYEILAKYMRLREEMRDYTRETMREAHADGLPVMRAMFLEFPDDGKCWDVKDQYMFGADLLVAPVMSAGATDRDVYLPSGARWLNAFTGDEYKGGQTVNVSAPISQTPLFLRDGRHGNIADFIKKTF